MKKEKKNQLNRIVTKTTPSDFNERISNMSRLNGK